MRRDVLHYVPVFQMSQQLHLPASNTSVLASRLRYILQKWPRLVAEYKPAFGAIFQSYLANYTHWGN